MEKFTIEDLLDQSNFWLSPISAMKRIPDWYKEMKTFTQGPDTPTIKKCPPVLEMYKHGYFILNSVEIFIERTYDDKGNFEYLYGYPPNYQSEPLISTHGRQQVWKVPLIDRWKTNHALKYNNPFLIKTPPGYSTMFLNPTINDIDEEYYAFEAIVDTDIWHEVNFPFIINWSNKPLGKKYTLKRGQPIVLAIPFKRTDFQSVTYWDNKKMKKLHKHLSANKGNLSNNFYKNISTKIKIK